MRAVWPIARRELGAAFASPIATIVLAGFVFVSGLLFFDGFFVSRVARLDALFARLPTVLLLFAPALSMRLLAEERGSGTLEMLLTLPVRDHEVVIGKYLAAVATLALALLATAPFPMTVAWLGDLDLGPVAGGYLGALLLGALYLAAALLASALARNQVVAFVIGLVLCFGLFALRWLASPTAASGRVVQYVSPGFHYDPMWRGVVELRSVVYFVSGAALFVLLAVQAVAARRWR